MSIIDDQPSSKSHEISPDLAYYIKMFATWTNVIAIIYFIIIGFLALGALAALLGVGIGTAFSSLDSLGRAGTAGMTIGILILMGGYITLILIPTLRLYQASKAAKAFLQNRDQNNMNIAIRQIARFFKFLGVLMIIFVSFYLLFGLLGGMGALLA